MDRRRRRYVPKPEGLEVRSLLSAVEVVAAAPPDPAGMAATVEVGPLAQVAVPPAEPASAPSSTPAEPSPAAARNRRQPEAPRPRTAARQQSLDELIQLRLQRIDRLPDFLQLLDPDRALPQEEVAAIQRELRGFVGQLRPPAQPIAEGFVDQLRNALAQASVKRETIAAMNFASERLLASAGVPESSIAVITDGLTALARSAAGSSRAVSVMANDYALVLQTAMGVGRPIGRAELLGLASPLTRASVPAAGLGNPLGPAGAAPGGGMF